VAKSLWLHPAAKPGLFVACLLPLAWLIYAIGTNQLGANPAEGLIRGLGDWTLRALWLTLAITPLRQLSGIAALARFRRMLGLFTALYASLHLLAYAWLDQGFDLPTIAADIATRHGGHLDLLDGAHGRGLRVRLSLPGTNP
jgi:sulfoxide reductase heme-binding subunit YedZ